MDILHGTGHDTLPHVRHVAWDRPFHWIEQGIVDLAHTPTTSLIMGLVFCVIGYLMFALAQQRPQFLLAAVSGFLLVAPLLAVGFYVQSQHLARGQGTSLAEIGNTLMQRWRPLAMFGVLLAFFYACWERLTTALVAYLLGNQWIWGFEELVREIFLTDRHPTLAMVWMFSGGLVAGLTFVCSVVTAPLLLDRESVRVDQAIATSIDVVAENVPAMLVWSLSIAVLTFLGFATFMLGLALIMPILGHATWHAYRDLVE